MNNYFTLQLNSDTHYYVNYLSGKEQTNKEGLWCLTFPTNVTTALQMKGSGKNFRTLDNARQELERILKSYFEHQLRELEVQGEPTPQPEETYEEAYDRWRNHFGCIECGTEGISNFTYLNAYANGEEWQCRTCFHTTMFNEEPRLKDY